MTRSRTIVNQEGCDGAVSLSSSYIDTVVNRHIWLFIPSVQRRQNRQRKLESSRTPINTVLTQSSPRSLRARPQGRCVSILYQYSVRLSVRVSLHAPICTSACKCGGPESLVFHKARVQASIQAVIWGSTMPGADEQNALQCTQFCHKYALLLCTCCAVASHGLRKCLSSQARDLYRVALSAVKIIPIPTAEPLADMNCSAGLLFY